MKLFRKLAVDLGTNNFLVWESGEGVIFSEPSLVAVSVDDGKVLAVGNDVKKMIGKTPEYIEVVKPMAQGVISDYEVTQAMIKAFFRQVMGPWWPIGPEMVVAVPGGATQVEQRAVSDAVLSAGARRVHLIDQTLAAAIGAKIPVAEAEGNLLVNIGGGMTEVAVISLGGVVINRSVKTAGDSLDEAIELYLKKKFNLVIGIQTAEVIKLSLGSAIKLKRPETMDISGRDTIYGLPKTITIDSDMIYEAIRPVLDVVVGTIKQTLEVTRPELVADVMDKGMVLTGGGALLKNLNLLLTREIGVAAHVAIEPDLSVIKGAGMVLENLDAYERALK